MVDSKFTVLIADDEPPALRKLSNWIGSRQEFELVAACRSGAEVLAAFRQNPVDLVVLDIEMPEYSGLEVVDRFGVESAPVIVFVTAYPQYALPAYERAVIAYLLKPYDKQRLNACLDLALAQVKGRKVEGNSTSESSAQDLKLERLAVPSLSGETHYLHLSDVQAFRSEGNYVWVHHRDGKYLLRSTMRKLEEQLDRTRFVRCHRTAIVNIQFVSMLRPSSHGDSWLVLQDGSEVPVSRTKRVEMLDVLPKRIGG